MGWTNPRTWTTGELVSASMLNEQLRDNISYLKDIALVTITSDVSVTGTAFMDIVSAGAITYAATPILIEFYAVRVTAGGTDTMVISLMDGATDLGRVLALPPSVQANPCSVAVKLTPTAALQGFEIGRAHV